VQLKVEYNDESEATNNEASMESEASPSTVVVSLDSSYELDSGCWNSISVSGDNDED
jgi:hypothetical protein